MASVKVDDMEIKLLLISNDPAEAGVIKHVLADAGDDSFEVEWVTQLSQGLERLTNEDVELVILTLSHPDSVGIQTFDKVFLAVPHIPILVITSGNEQEL